LRRHGYGDVHALVDMLQHWHRALNDGQSVRVLFVDYAKAFDHIDHNIVIKKLKSLGLSDFQISLCFVFRPTDIHGVSKKRHCVIITR